MSLAAAREAIAAADARDVPGVALEHVPAEPAADDVPERAGVDLGGSQAIERDSRRAGHRACAPRTRRSRRTSPRYPASRSAACSASAAADPCHVATGWPAGSGPVRVSGAVVATPQVARRGEHAAARRRIRHPHDGAAVRQHHASRLRGSLPAPARGRTEHLAVRGVADVVAIASVASAAGAIA